MGWETSTQPVLMMGHPLTNVIAHKGSGSPEFLLGAHYDSRMRADRDLDPSRRSQPVPGANDGASGVAVLLELARVLPEELAQRAWIVFFDGEDNGDLPGWDWILGSRAFVAETKIAPQVVIILDMVGDADLNIYIERASDPGRVAAIWASASALGYSQEFLPLPKYQMIDDHLPFVKRGIPSVLIIDFDYPYWHTTADTADKVSPESLQIVGRTLLNWFLTQE
jgi:Zn-dependent M28 family amino/carboxypeptidase